MGSFISSLVTPPQSDEDDSSAVKSFHSAAEWREHFNSIKETPKLLVIDFTATWCGPCRFINPVIKQMADKFTDVDFVKIDVDELSEVSKEFGVEAMPTFVLLKEGKEVTRVVGAKKDELDRKVEMYRSHS